MELEWGVQSSLLMKNWLLSLLFYFFTVFVHHINYWPVSSALPVLAGFVLTDSLLAILLVCVPATCSITSIFHFGLCCCLAWICCFLWLGLFGSSLSLVGPLASFVCARRKWYCCHLGPFHQCFLWQRSFCSYSHFFLLWQCRTSMPMWSCWGPSVRPCFLCHLGELPGTVS